MSDINSGFACHIASCRHHTGYHSCDLSKITVGTTFPTMNVTGANTSTAECENFEAK